MNTFFRANLVALYLLALVATVAVLPWGIGPLVQRVALITLVIHVAETVLAFKHVRDYRGSLLNSVVLSLLFGLLHWLPIAKAQRQAGAPGA